MRIGIFIPFWGDFSSWRSHSRGQCPTARWFFQWRMLILSSSHVLPQFLAGISIILAFQTHETLWFSATSLQFNGEKLWTPQVPSALMGVLFQHDDFSPDIAEFVMFILWICYCNFSTTWGIKYGTFCIKLIVLIFFRANISWRCQYYSYWRIATGQIKTLLNFVDCDCTVEADATMTGLQ